MLRKVSARRVSAKKVQERKCKGRYVPRSNTHVVCHKGTVRILSGFAMFRTVPEKWGA